ncbi:Rieske 2Fe-2S domain-containing protein [Luteolibacter sp. LG18]|uniref:QcrA and Rieske domain-containing protein n=1 Tax=Luteolibacter sp. LG18 TaxID=2819286 RepID=UPI002B2ADBD3|nr:hypothetical protein llg_22550 [Luteolibacter sp. LG18]
MDSLTTSSRRRWVKQFVLGSVAALSGPRWCGKVLAEVTSTGPGPAVIRLKIADIPVLAAPGGSVQYGFNTGIHPFTLNRVTTERFVTLDSVCTHFGCIVGRYKERIVGTDNSVNPPVPILANLMKCPCHGSRYDIEGRVYRDASGQSTEPAKADLRQFETRYDAATGIVSITIPDLALHVRSISVHRQEPGETVRLKLVIPVTAYSSYEIKHRTDLTDPFSPVPFSATPTGPANQTTLSPTTSGEVTVYVDATGSTGFFVVGLILEDVPP